MDIGRTHGASAEPDLGEAPPVGRANTGGGAAGRVEANRLPRFEPRSLPRLPAPYPDALFEEEAVTRDVRVSMPPLPACFEGVDQVLPLLERANAMGEWRLVPAWANCMPEAMSYLRRPGDHALRAFKLDVLHVSDGRIHESTTFQPTLLAAFGLPEMLA